MVISIMAKTSSDSRVTRAQPEAPYHLLFLLAFGLFDVFFVVLHELLLFHLFYRSITVNFHAYCSLITKSVYTTLKIHHSCLALYFV